ncbi:Calcium-dependent protein kinase 3 [Symbiodinium microadriaticum]|uniref:N-glycosyl-oligosaccharide-glycoprotein N-acetylglucosaminyltransferase I n=1 Tax=Symbiodinium microadriaticum TaxID=2951 RepID=A0A1Q9CUB9_SYMMI|nr:Calcium-dependent protein kinase 3 [Symbiodinium microadriaticum]CAE7845913.1 CPK3 [Symbiodinium microadriaticum]
MSRASPGGSIMTCTVEEQHHSPYWYFGAMRTLLRGDTDLFCVSAWNDNGYSTLVQDPKVAYRTDFFPGLGWMMDRDLWGELRNRWAACCERLRTWLAAPSRVNVQGGNPHGAMRRTAAALVHVAPVIAWSRIEKDQSVFCQDFTSFHRLRATASPESEKRKLSQRLIKHTDFVYRCLSHGQLEDFYSLGKELGFGSFGTIYLAQHKMLGPGFAFAVKKIRKSENDEKLQELLMNEIHALMDLDHPNVVKLLRYFDEGSYMYLVFELCQGPDLQTRLENEGRVEEKEAANTMRQMLAALKCCHEHYIGHFDVKPENFIYRSTDMTRLKMIDLGLATRFKRSRKEIRGTSAYMAPEMWDGFFGPEADSWGCGAVFFNLLTGKSFFPPTMGDDDIKILAKDRKWVRNRLRVLRDSGLSKEAIDLVSKLMRHDRHFRLTSREALQHPFFTLHSEREAAEVLCKHNPEYAELDRQAQEIVDQLVGHFTAFAAQPVLVRAALLLMAHVTAYSFEHARPQRVAFSKLDRSVSGGLSMEDLEAFYEDSGMPMPEMLESAFSGVDVDDDGYITYIEFLSATLPRWARSDRTFCRRVFEILDRNCDGIIDAADLAQAFFPDKDEKGSGICAESLAEICDGQLTWKRFLELMQQDNEGSMDLGVAYWDEFMRRPDVRKGRHCIRPEISRSFTFGEEGVSGGQFFKQHLGKIKLNDVVVDWSKQDLSHLASAEAFDDYLTAQIRTAAVVSIENIDSFAGQSKVLRIEYEDAKYKAVAQKFSLMPDEKEGIRRMSYRGVIPLSWHTNRVYLHTRTWPPGLPNYTAATVRTWRSFSGEVEVQFEESFGGFSITGFVVWEAAHQLSNFLCSHKLLVEGQRVLELGAGCGLVSAVSASLGAEVTATDRADMVPRLRCTAQLGKPAQRFEVAQLDWHADPPWPAGHFDLILGSDITYGSHCHDDLLPLLWRLMVGSKTSALLTHGVRSPEQTALLWHQILKDWPGTCWLLHDYEVLERCHVQHKHDSDLPDKCITFVLGATRPAGGTLLGAAYETFLMVSQERPLVCPQPEPELLGEGILGPALLA